MVFGFTGANTGIPRPRRESTGGRKGMDKEQTDPKLLAPEEIKPIIDYVKEAIRFPLFPKQLVSMVILHFDMPDEQADQAVEQALIEIAKAQLAKRLDSCPKCEGRGWFNKYTEGFTYSGRYDYPRPYPSGTVKHEECSTCQGTGKAQLAKLDSPDREKLGNAITQIVYNWQHKGLARRDRDDQIIALVECR